MARRNNKKLLIRRQWCKGCLICVEFCPPKVLALDGDEKVYLKDEAGCTACGLCEMRCPDFAIEMVDADGAASEEKEHPAPGKEDA